MPEETVGAGAGGAFRAEEGTGPGGGEGRIPTTAECGPFQEKAKLLAGGGYDDFWGWRGRYRVVKGSRASKKSKTTALNLLARMMDYPDSNLLVVRKTYRTLKDSCYADLRWAARKLGASKEWKGKIEPLELTYLPTGQKIFFRGLDDPLKITSIAAERGSLCWMWIEEAYEISDESDFSTLDESIRGRTADGLFKQITLTFNPWDERHWLKTRFFDEPDAETLAKTTTYACNEWLDDADRALFERMRRQNPRRYRVAGLGEWGVAEGLVFENWREEAFDIDAIRRLSSVRSVFGLDFGYTNDPTALFCGLIDPAAKTLWVFDEMYRRGMSNEAIWRTVKRMGYAKERIIADSAEPKSIDRLREMGLTRILPARKGADSVRNGIDFLQDYTIIVHPRCVSFRTEIGNYAWSTDRQGRRRNIPVDGYNHLMDAMRYACEDVMRGEIFSFA